MESILQLRFISKVHQLLLFLGLSLFLFSGQTFAQQLSGTYSIGASGDYPSFSDAISSLTTNGISGPVTFEVQTGTYSEQVLLGAISGASETNTITFQSQSGNPEDVVIQYSAIGTADNFVIRFDGGSHYVLKNIKVLALGTTYARTLHAQGDVQNITIEQCMLESPDTSTANFERGNVVLQPTTSSSIRFFGNTIVGGSNGIYYRGGTSSSFRGSGVEIINNTILEVFSYGIYVDRLTAAVIEDNRVTMRSTSWSSSYALELNEVEGATRVVGNRLFGGRQYGLNMQFCNAVDGSPALVANNMIGSSSSGQTVFLY
ncbi:right-handed parallel beta-helix repeat-containing protein, partial [Algoriphagus mannitolivorans]|uniref:hypothetical protein n=1 Tax=Algoriphagus mannitolivorans TaxID=226504 RepID=UPI00047BDF34